MIGPQLESGCPNPEGLWGRVVRSSPSSEVSSSSPFHAPPPSLSSNLLNSCSLSTLQILTNCPGSLIWTQISTSLSEKNVSFSSQTPLHSNPLRSPPNAQHDDQVPSLARSSPSPLLLLQFTQLVMSLFQPPPRLGDNVLSLFASSSSFSTELCSTWREERSSSPFALSLLLGRRNLQEGRRGRLRFKRSWRRRGRRNV